MVGIFGDQDMCDQSLGRNAVLDQTLRRRGLRHFPSASRTSIFGAACHNHLELGGDHVEPFGYVLADAVLEAATACAGLVGDIDHHLFARKMRGQCTTVDVPFECCRRFGACRSVLLGRGLRCRDRLLHIFECEHQLIGIEPLGAATEAVALQLLDDRHQASDLVLRVVLRISRCSEFLGMTCALRKNESAQRLCISGERIRSVYHVATEPDHGAHVAKTIAPDSICRSIRALLAVLVRALRAPVSNPSLPTAQKAATTSIASRRR